LFAHENKLALLLIALVVHREEVAVDVVDVPVVAVVVDVPDVSVDADV